MKWGIEEKKILIILYNSILFDVFTFYIEFTTNYFHNWKMLRKMKHIFKFCVNIFFCMFFTFGIRPKMIFYDYRIIFHFTNFMALLFDIYTFNQLQFVLLWYESQSNTNKNSSVFNFILNYFASLTKSWVTYSVSPIPLPSWTLISCLF